MRRDGGWPTVKIYSPGCLSLKVALFSTIRGSGWPILKMLYSPDLSFGHPLPRMVLNSATANGTKRLLVSSPTRSLRGLQIGMLLDHLNQKHLQRLLRAVQNSTIGENLRLKDHCCREQARC